MLDQIIVGKRSRPRRVMLYGTGGVGKSTWAASLSSRFRVLFAQFEEGLDDIGADRTPLIDSMQQWTLLVAALLESDHEYTCLVIDSADWMDRVLQKKVCLQNRKSSIEDFSYGKGWVFLAEAWEGVLAQLDRLRKEKDMMIVLLAHAKTARVAPPDKDPYMRVEPDFHDRVGSQLIEWVDELLYASYKVDVVVKEGDFGRKQSRAIGKGARIVWTAERPTHLAKARLDLPLQMDLDADEFLKALDAVEGDNNTKKKGE